MLAAGTYEFDDSMCTGYQGGSALCINRDVTIEAEVAGTVVLDAKGARRVIDVSDAGRAELIGLNVTGGAAEDVSLLASIEPTRDIAACTISYSLYRVVACALMAMQIWLTATFTTTWLLM